MRHTIKGGFLLIAVALVCSTGIAAAQQLNDFAFGMRLVTPPNSALVKIMLPERMDRDLVQEDGSDIRLFAADGSVVPHCTLPSLSGSGPARVLFFASKGGQSYLLAYGSGKIGAATPPPDLVQRAGREGSRAAAVRLGPRIELGGPARLQAAADPSDGRMLSLSTLLLGCVLLMAFFAWWTARRLLRG